MTQRRSFITAVLCKNLKTSGHLKLMLWLNEFSRYGVKMRFGWVFSIVQLPAELMV